MACDWLTAVCWGVKSYVVPDLTHMLVYRGIHSRLLLAKNFLSANSLGILGDTWQCIIKQVLFFFQQENDALTPLRAVCHTIVFPYCEFCPLSFSSDLNFWALLSMLPWNKRNNADQHSHPQVVLLHLMKTAWGLVLSKTYFLQERNWLN